MRTLSAERFRERHLNDDTRFLYKSLTRHVGPDEATRLTLRLIEDLSGARLQLKSHEALLREQRLERASEMLSDGYEAREVARETHLPHHTVRRLARGEIAA